MVCLVLELENGIPSHDTFRRVFILLDNIELRSLFVEWISSAISLSKGTLVNIDGKNLCGSKEPIRGKKALNVVSAWASEQSVVLGQVRCEEKSNAHYGNSRIIEDSRFGGLHRARSMRLGVKRK